MSFIPAKPITQMNEAGEADWFDDGVGGQVFAVVDFDDAKIRGGDGEKVEERVICGATIPYPEL